MPNDAKSELQDLLEQVFSSIRQHTKDEPKHYKQIQTKAELDFVKKCCKSNFSLQKLILIKSEKMR